MVLTRLRNIVFARAKLITYKSAILPQLTYCHIVWNFCRSSDNRKLERIQERALRVIFNRKSGTYDEFLKLAKLPTLKNRRLQDIAILMYKEKNELCPSYIKEIFQNNNINRYSFRNLDFVIPRVNTVTCQEFGILNTFKAKIRKLDLVGLTEDNCKNCTLCSS